MFGDQTNTNQQNSQNTELFTNLQNIQTRWEISQQFQCLQSQQQSDSKSILTEYNKQITESHYSRNIENIYSVFDKIDQIKKLYDDFFEFIRYNAQKMLSLMQKEIQIEIIQQLENKNDEKPIVDSRIDELKNLIENQFMQFQKDNQLQKLQDILIELGVFNQYRKVQKLTSQQNIRNEIENKILLHENVKYVPLLFVQQKWEMFTKEKAEKLSKQREEYNKKIQQLQKSIKDWEQTYNNLLKEMKEEEKAEHSTQTHQSYFMRNLQYKEQVVQLQYEHQVQSINFQLMQQHKNASRQFEWCNAIAFNQNSSIMAAACYLDIKLFKFQNGQLEFLQQLKAHSKLISTLYFMKNSQQLVSGADDNEIIVWGIKQTQYWEQIQVLRKNGHVDPVEQVIMNKDENLIISCGDDSTIKFWILKSNWECDQTLQCHSPHHVYSISLNDSQNKLVSCGGDKTISIIEQARNKQWKKIKVINVSQPGLRICFIENDLITYQPAFSNQIEIYRQEKKEFIKQKTLKIGRADNCYYYFPQQYHKDILLNKNGDTLYVIRRKNYYDFQVEQQITFGSCYFLGAMTQDGRYLVTWDQQSCQFQAREQD